jgi:hypothetical protein
LFHDIMSGDNATSTSGGRFLAVTGFDLCTGWGTPTEALISALVSPGPTFTTYTVSLSANPSSEGGVTGSASYLSGSNVTVTAIPFPGFLFESWTENGNVVSTSASYTFTASANRTLVANFVKNTNVYTITVAASPVGTGDVTGGGTFTAGSNQSIYASPRRRYAFVNWTENGVVVSTSPFYILSVDANHNFVANFASSRARRRHR